jgi:hypothetical protein
MFDVPGEYYHHWSHHARGLTVRLDRLRRVVQRYGIHKSTQFYYNLWKDRIQQCRVSETLDRTGQYLGRVSERGCMKHRLVLLVGSFSTDNTMNTMNTMNIPARGTGGVDFIRAILFFIFFFHVLTCMTTTINCFFNV